MFARCALLKYSQTDTPQQGYRKDNTKQKQVVNMKVHSIKMHLKNVSNYQKGFPRKVSSIFWEQDTFAFEFDFASRHMNSLTIFKCINKISVYFICK